ncbi:MAG TPA: type II toxin-antitoxin system VapC family toxin [Burkholderiales bacterium]
MVLVDTNVLLDVVEDHPQWADWSQQQLEAAALNHQLVINAVVYAELSIGFRRIEEVEAVLSETQILLEEIPREALFLAGKVFQRYKARGGTRTGVLPDFFIGAHAAVLGIPLLTRDARQVADYFPKLDLIAPAKERS